MERPQVQIRSRGRVVEERELWTRRMADGTLGAVYRARVHPLKGTFPGPYHIDVEDHSEAKGGRDIITIDGALEELARKSARKTIHTEGDDAGSKSDALSGTIDQLIRLIKESQPRFDFAPRRDEDPAELREQISALSRRAKQYVDQLMAQREKIDRLNREVAFANTEKDRAIKAASELREILRTQRSGPASSAPDSQNLRRRLEQAQRRNEELEKQAAVVEKALAKAREDCDAAEGLLADENERSEQYREEASQLREKNAELHRALRAAPRTFRRGFLQTFLPRLKFNSNSWPAWDSLDDVKNAKAVAVVDAVNRDVTSPVGELKALEGKPSGWCEYSFGKQPLRIYYKPTSDGVDVLISTKSHQLRDLKRLK